MSEDPFLTHRSLLFTVAYEMLGSAADAEHAVQETWLRWARVRLDQGGELDTVATLTVEDGRITHIYAIRNPEKLRSVAAPASLASS